MKKKICYRLGKNFFLIEKHESITEVEVEAKMEAQNRGERAVLKHQLKIFLYCLYGEEGLKKYLETKASNEYEYTVSWNYRIDVYRKAFNRFAELFPRSVHPFRPL